MGETYGYRREFTLNDPEGAADNPNPIWVGELKDALKDQHVGAAMIYFVDRHGISHRVGWAYIGSAGSLILTEEE